MAKGRPRRSKEDVEKLVNIIKENKDSLLANGNIVSRTHPIWNHMSEALNYLYSPMSIFTAAAKNYYNVKEILGFQKEYDIEIKSVNTEQLSESTCSSSSEDENETDKKNSLIFTIVLSSDEYKELDVHSEIYNRNDVYERKLNKRFRLKREYTIFEKRNWSYIINKKIENRLRELDIDCVINFKRHKIYSSCLSKFANFFGYCKDCGASLRGKIKREPKEGEDVVINFTLQNISTHSKVSIKRPLSGNRRREIAEHLVKTNIAPSHYRQVLASKDFTSGSKEPSWIPKLGTLRVAKNEAIKNYRIDDDPVYSICQMKVDSSMKGAIQNIGLDPFFVYIWTNTQMHVYNRYCASEYAKLCIDATGGLVKRLAKVTKEKSKHIFLYDCTILSKTLDRDNQFSVCNMLSESQNAVSIYSWLAHWIRAGAAYPQEVVTDMSLALLYAVVLAFTSFKSLEDYLIACFNAIIDHLPFNEKCYIRLDVAHLMKLVSQFPSLKKQHRLTRQFYLRSIGQLIQSADISDAENIIRAIFTVALSDTEGLSIETENPTSCEIMKEWLKRRAGTGSIEKLVAPLILEENRIDRNTIKDTQDHFLKTDIINSKSDFLVWVAEIARECKVTISKSDQVGNRGNQQCLPGLVDDLTKLCKYLPLWTAVMMRYFPDANIIASSASVESNINNIKNRMCANSTLPLRVDDFLKTFVLCTHGANKLANSAMNESYLECKESSTSCTTKDNTNVVSEKVKTRVSQKDCILGTSTPDIFCQSCQLKESAPDMCFSCGQSVHRNKLCSTEDRHLNIICLSCFRKEQLSFEDWRGLGSDAAKKRPRHSYLEPSSELLVANYANLRKITPIGVIRNGHLVDLKPIKISENVSVILSNTCAFDSFIQLICGGFCDSDVFKELILLNSKISKICEVVSNMVKQGVTKKIYRLRAEILMKVFHRQENPCGIVSLSVETEIGNLLTCLDFNSCAMERVECTQCLFFEARFLHSLEISVTEEGLDLTELEKFVQYSTFRRVCLKNNCPGKLQKKVDLSLTHILIEPLNIVTKKFELYISLETIPKKLVLNGTIYILRGIIAHIGPDQGIGHFICYSFRHNNMWEIFDDRNTKSKPCSPKNVVRVQILLYTA